MKSSWLARAVVLALVTLVGLAVAVASPHPLAAILVLVLWSLLVSQEG